MAEYALMQKGEATMNVPPDKIPAYEADGWIIIKRPGVPELKPERSTVSTETETLTVEEAIEKIGKKSRRGS